MPDWPESFSSAEFTYTVMSLYVGFNVAWAVTCVIVIVAAAKNVSNWFAYIPWILLAVANIILDIVATIHYATDAADAQKPQNLLEDVIGLNLTSVPPELINILFEQEIFKSAEGITSVPSIIMALMTSRLGILWLLNVLFLICVVASVPRLLKKQERRNHLTTHPQHEPRNHGFHNKSYIGDAPTNKPGPQHDIFDKQDYSRPYGYTRGDLRSSSITPQPLTNGGPPRSVAVSGNNLPSPATQPYITELHHAQHRYHQPSAPSDEYEWQALNRMPVHSGLKGRNGADEQIRSQHIRRTDSDRPYQPRIKNRPAPAIPPKRTNLHTPASRTNEENLEPRQGFDNSLASDDKYMPPSLSRPSVPHDVRGNSEQDVQRKAPHLHRTESDRTPYRPQGPGTNLSRRTSTRDEVDRPQDHNSKVDRRSSGSQPGPTATLTLDELSNQRPWSYFGPRNGQIKPQPIKESVIEEELEKPPVPVPDYTLHFGKTARPVASKWSDDGISSTDSVAFHRGTSASALEDKRY